MTNKQIALRYAALIKEVATVDFYKVDLTNRVNCYTCDVCNRITKTIDRDAGVTPMFHACENCRHPRARSSFYSDISPHLNPSQEWYRPTLDEVLKMKNESALVEHVLSGGLLVRGIKK